MSNIVEYVIKIKDSGATSSINRIRGGMKDLDAQAKATNNTLSSFRNALIAIGAVGITKKIIDTVVAFEKYNAILANVEGSNQAGARTMETLKDVASDTSSSIDEIVRAYSRLASSGTKLNEDQLRTISDFALAVNPNRDVTDFAEAIIDAQVNDFERLREFNIRARNLGDTIQFRTRGVTTEIQNSEKAITEFLISLGKLPGIAGINERILNTLGGQIAKLGDNFTFLLKEVGDQLVPLFKVVNNLLDSTVKGFRNFIKFLDQTGVGIDGLVIALGAGTIAALAYSGAAGVAAAVTSALASPVVAAAAAIAALTAGFINAYNNSVALRGVLAGLSNLINSDFQDLGGLDGFLNKIITINNVVRDFYLELLEIPEAIGSAINSFFLKLGEGALLAVNILRAVSDDFDDLAKFIEQRAGIFQDGIRKEIVSSQKRKEEEEKRAGDTSTNATPSSISSTSTSTSPSIVRSAAPRQFNINIENLVRQFTVDVKNNLTTSAEEVKDKIQQALLEAVADVEIARTL